MFRRVLIAASFGEQFIIWLLWHNGRFSSMIINIIPGPYTSYIPQVLTAPSKGKSSRIIYYLSTLAQWLFFISYNILPQVLTAQYGPCSWQYNVVCGMLPVFHQLLYIKASYCCKNGRCWLGIRNFLRMPHKQNSRRDFDLIQRILLL